MNSLAKRVNSKNSVARQDLWMKSSIIHFIKYGQDDQLPPNVELPRVIYEQRHKTTVSIEWWGIFGLHGTFNFGFVFLFLFLSDLTLNVKLLKIQVFFWFWCCLKLSEVRSWCVCIIIQAYCFGLANIFLLLFISKHFHPVVGVFFMFTTSHCSHCRSFKQPGYRK